MSILDVIIHDIFVYVKAFWTFLSIIFLGGVKMRLKELREEKNLTQWDVANGIQTSQRNIGRWENGEVIPSADAVVKLADYFEVSADYLLGRTDDLGAFVPPRSDLSQDEQQLLHCFRELPGSSQSLILGMIKSAADAAKRA